jgi:ribosomal 30S subunit maturation factor RimM
LRVVNQQGLELGRVERFIDTPAHAVMVVRGAEELWLPVTPQHLRRVDLANGEIRVDWSPAED